jgi:3-isopropylmalate dehydrogenase
MLTGTFGMQPSQAWAAQAFGMYEPIHGSAPASGKGCRQSYCHNFAAAMLMLYP